METITEIQQHGGSGSPGMACYALRVLRLTLKRKWFDMIASGEKREEYRTPGKWINSRVNAAKVYDVVEFSNGYGANVPKVVVEFAGWQDGPGFEQWGALKGIEYRVIFLGRVLSHHNSFNEQPAVFVLHTQHVV